MSESVYLRIPQSSATNQDSMQPSSSSPALTAVLVDGHPVRRRSNSKSSLMKNWRKYKHKINLDYLRRMRLRWRMVAKILGGILFLKIGLSIIGTIVGSDPSDTYTDPGSDPLPRSSDDLGGEGGVPAVMVPVITEPPPPPPIPVPAEAIKCETLKDYQHMISNAPETDSWQTIQLGISFGYSAYFDDRLEGVVSIKVMGLADEWLDAKPPLCQLWFPDRVEPFALPVNITNYPAQPTVRYKAVMYSCQYTPSQPDMPPPVAVSMSSEACAQPISMFKVNYFDRSTPYENRDKFSVCLASPMRMNFSEPGEMVDWIEVHKLFGVSKYYMYEHDIANNVQPYLQYYVEKGEMEVQPWKLPPEIRDPREGVKAFGHLAMINDCLYRNMFRSKYIVFLDLDEMMVPRGLSKTLEEALVSTACQDKAQTIIRSAFFRKQWTNDEKYASDERMVKRSLVSLLKTKRERKVLAINVHAKYIVIPELIDAVETLAALRFIPTVVNATGEATCILLAKECLLHHYRYYDEFAGDWMIDRKMHEFTKSIVERTAAVFDSVEALISLRAVAESQQIMEAQVAAEVPAVVEAPVEQVVPVDAAPPSGEVPPVAEVQQEAVVLPVDSNVVAPPADGSVVALPVDANVVAPPVESAPVAGAEPVAPPVEAPVVQDVPAVPVDTGAIPLPVEQPALPEEGVPPV